MTGRETKQPGTPDHEAPRRLDRRGFLGMGGAAIAAIGGVTMIARSGFALEATPPASGTPEASPTASPAASPVATGSEFSIATVDIGFEPKDLTIPANTDVAIVVTNDGVMPHDFVIDQLRVNSGRLASGTASTVTINTAPGTYTFYCSVPGHKQAGMRGTLTVE